MISEKYRNLCVVGDDDQSIYGWRGANIRNILDFEKDFPDARTIKLEQNYRSTKNILSAANEVINNNINRKKKRLWTEHEEGAPIRVFKAATDLDESAYISDSILRMQSEGASYSDFAILYRTNAQSRAIEDSLVYKNIPYRIFGGVRFYERREIRDVLAYLRSVYNPLDAVALRRIINVPKRGIGDTTIEKISLYADQNEISFFDALKEVDNIFDSAVRNKKIKDFVSIMEELRKLSVEMPVSALIEEIFERTGYLLDLMSEKSDDAEDRVNNVKELFSKAVEFEKTAESPLLADFLEEVALVADIDRYEEGDETVVLMTLHSAKGLEFPTVFIAGFEEGIFPSYRSTVSGDIKDLEEERRLCYVGITRAKERLFLTMANQRMQHGHIVNNAPSSFIKEIPSVFLENANKSTRKGEPVQPKTVSSFRTAIAVGNKPSGFGGKTYSQSAPMPAPKDVSLDFAVGDSVRQMKYGVGEVLSISPAGADFEVTVSFPAVGNKKFMAHLSKLQKV
jgi:DNA helicase-2/ATP-dependent DNA helicase PcrA